MKGETVKALSGTTGTKLNDVLQENLFEGRLGLVFCQPAVPRFLRESKAASG